MKNASPVNLLWLLQGTNGIAILKNLSRRAFFRNFFVVMSGTAVAQLIAFAFSPVISRLYDPVHFGIFGTYLSVTAVLGAAATLNFTDALMLPKEDEEAAPLFVLACLGTGAITLGAVIFCLFAPDKVLHALGMSDLRGLLWFIPFSVLLLGGSQVLTSWCTRLKAFKQTSQAQVVRSLAVCAGQGGAGAAGFGGVGLIAGSVLADSCAAACLGQAAFAQSASSFRASLHWKTLRLKAREFRDFALYGCPQNVMNALSQGIPVLALAHYYGVAVAGFYAFGIRLLQVPMSFVLTSLRQVLFQKLSHLNANDEDIYHPFLKSTGVLLGLSFVPALVGFLVAPTLFAFVFGEQWRTAGEYARWLIFWFCPMFCNLPATLAVRILRLQRNLFLFDACLLACRVAVLVLGGLWFAPLYTIIGLSVVGSVFNIAFILYVGLRLHREYGRKNPACANPAL